MKLEIDVSNCSYSDRCLKIPIGRVSDSGKREPKMNSNRSPEPKASLVFVGDFSDPFVEVIRNSLDPLEFSISDVNWPENSVDEDEPVRGVMATLPKIAYVVVHRRSLGPISLAAFANLRAAVGIGTAARPKIDVLLGDLVRYSDVQILAALVDRITPEAIAPDVLAGRLRRLISSTEPGLTDGQSLATVGVLTTNGPLGDTLAAWIEEFGYRPLVMEGWSDPRLPREALLIWDVPVLSDRWLVELRAQSKRRHVLALVGLANRDTIMQAKAAGVSACLDLPFEIDDLRDLLTIHVTNTGDHSTARPLRNSAERPARPVHGVETLRSDPGHLKLAERSFPARHAGRLSAARPNHDTRIDS